MRTINFLNLAKQTAFFSFSIGTLIFITDKAIDSTDLKIYGLMYIVTAIIVNTVVLIRVLIEAMLNKKQRKDLILHSVLMLTNIPIVILYIYLM